MKKHLLLVLCCYGASAYGDNAPKNCLGCKLRREEFAAINGLIDAGKILIDSSAYFEARQDCYVPIPGFIVISSKRHIQSIDDFTAEEQHDFIQFVCKIRHNMRDMLSIEAITLIQEEDAHHFHVWLFPHYNWMDQFGHNIASIQSIMKWAKANLKTQENLEKVKQTAERLL